jgi:hypothetical protein
VLREKYRIPPGQVVRKCNTTERLFILTRCRYPFYVCLLPSALKSFQLGRNWDSSEEYDGRLSSMVKTLLVEGGLGIPRWR